MLPLLLNPLAGELPAPLAAYNFDEASGAVLDVTGNGHGFTPDASITRQTGHTNTGLRHESTAANSPGPTIFGQTAQRTLMAWVKRTSNSVDGWILEMKNGTADTGVWGFLYSGTTIQARAKNSSNVATFASAAQPTVNVFHHLAMTYDGTTIRLFIDGVQAATAAFTGPIWASATAFHCFDTVGTETVIDDVRVYDVALDAAMITTLMGTPVTSGGTTVDLGIATETDSALGLAAAKARTVGQNTETDATPRLATAKALAADAATETDQARALASTKQATLSAAVEADSARPVAASKQATLGAATEAGSARQIVAAKTVTLGAATETDAVFRLLDAKRIDLASSAESDAAQQITTGAAPAFTFDVAAEADTARPLAASKSTGLAFAGETDAALPLTYFKTVLLGVATETDTAARITPAKLCVLAAAEEIGTAYALVLAGPQPIPGFLTATNGGNALHAAHSQPDLTPSNAPSSHLEVSHGV